MINVNSENSKVTSMKTNANLILDEIASLKKNAAIIESNASGGTLISYINSMNSDINKLNNALSSLQSSISGISPVIQQVYHEEYVEWQRSQQKLLEKQEK